MNAKKLMLLLMVENGMLFPALTLVSGFDRIYVPVLEDLVSKGLLLKSEKENTLSSDNFLLTEAGEQLITDLVITSEDTLEG